VPDRLSQAALFGTCCTLLPGRPALAGTSVRSSALGIGRSWLRTRHRIGLFARRRQGKLRVHGRVCARVKPSGTGSLGLPRGRTEALLATCAGILLISRLGSLLSILSGPGEDVCCGPQSISQDFTAVLRGDHGLNRRKPILGNCRARTCWRFRWGVGGRLGFGCRLRLG
jgi:hypothetical protein